MNITLEQIDQLRSRANVNYQDAKIALEKANGDIVEALVLLEQQQKTVPPKSQGGGIIDWFKKIIKKGNRMKFSIKKSDDVKLKLPLTAVVLIGLFATHIFIVAALIALFTGHRFEIRDEEGNSLKINKAFNNISNAFSGFSTENQTNSTNTQNQNGSNIDLEKDNW